MCAMVVRIQNEKETKASGSIIFIAFYKKLHLAQISVS